MMVGALAEPVPVRVVALEPTTVLSLDYEQAMELTLRHPDLRRLWLTTYAGSLRKHFFGAAPKRAPMMLALIHDSPATRPAAERLIDRLREVGEASSPCSAIRTVAGAAGRAVPVAPRRRRPGAGRRRRSAGRSAEWQDANRIIFDVHADLKPERAAAADGIVDRAGLLRPAPARPTPRSAACRRSTCRPAAGATRSASPGCWRAAAPVAPAVPDLRDLACRDFKIAETPPATALGPVAGQRPGAAGPRPPRRAHRRGPRRRGRPRHVPPRRAQGPRAERHRRGHDRRHQRRRHDRHPLRLRPRPRLQRQPVRHRPAPLVDLPPACRGATTGTSCTSTAAGTSTRCSASTSTTGGSNNSPSRACPSPSIW